MLKTKYILIILMVVSIIFSGCMFKSIIEEVTPPTSGNEDNSSNDGNESDNTSNVENDENSNDTNYSSNNINELTNLNNMIESGEIVEQEILVKIRPEVNIEEIVDQVQGEIIETIPEISVVRISLKPEMTVSQAITILKKIEGVDYAEPNGICYMDLVPNDTDYANRQWAPQLTGAEEAWDITTGDNSIIIAVTDTGVEGTHPDLSGKVKRGWDTYNNMAILSGTDSSVNSHGTHCAGIAAAIGNNSQGIAGVAWGCEVMPIKMCKDDPNYTASWSDMAEAFIWAADNGAHIISCSFGGKYYSQTMKDSIDYAVNQGCTMFASMGNSAIDEVRYPAGYQSVIAVGATNAHDEIADFSTTGSHMSICAPGVEIYSTIPGGGYDYKSGTSMACPFAAGTAALLLSNDFTLSPYEIKTRLEESAVDLGMTGFDSIYGNGRVDINAALNNSEASDYGKIDVSVKDRLGTVVSGASVILWEDGAAISTTNSNEDGHAIFEYIPVGDYQVSVSLPPYNSALAENNPVTLAAGSTESINISFDTAIVPDVHANSNIGHSVSPLFQEAEFTNENFVSTLKEKIVRNINKEKFNRSNGLYYECCIWWDPYEGSDYYEVYRSKNGSGFVKIKECLHESGKEWYYLSDNDVGPENTYSYYVVAYGSGWNTDPGKIVTIDTFLPSCSLISPTDGSTIIIPNPLFEWLPVGVENFPYGSIESAYSLLLVFDDDTNEFTSIMFFGDLTTSQCHYLDDGSAVSLVDGHTYYWYYVGCGLDVSGEYIATSESEMWSFVYSEPSP